MPLSHLLLALAVVAIWGSNFVVMKAGLATWPPLMFAALRFLLSALPLFVLPRPPVALGWLVFYGLLIGVGQFGFLFYALQADITPGIASLLIQMQVFFTIGLSVVTHGEGVRPVQGLGLLLALAGILVIGVHADASGHGAITATGVALVLTAAFHWALGNIVIKRIGKVDILPFMAWSSLPPAIVLAAASLAIEGTDRIAAAFASSGVGGWSAALWQAVGNTLFGYGAWSWLLARHAAVTVTPMALLVPIFGLGASVLAGQEGLEPWKLLAGALVVTGLAATVWAGGPRSLGREG